MHSAHRARSVRDAKPVVIGKQQERRKELPVARRWRRSLTPLSRQMPSPQSVCLSSVALVAAEAEGAGRG
jgi:hypothetical protein